jgi:hypothetical protein
LARVQAAIQNAQSLQEIQRLENILQTGAIPDDFQITEVCNYFLEAQRS